MGIPIEHRLSASALRKRHRVLNHAACVDEPRSEGKAEAVEECVFGINQASLQSVVSFYESRRLNRSPTRRGRLMLVRTFLPHPVRMPRSLVGKVGSLIRPGSGGGVECPELQYVADLLSSGEISWLQMQNEEEMDNRGRNVQMTSVGVSILFAEDGDPETAREWDLGCWPGAQLMKGVDMFHVFLDVLMETVGIPGCRVHSLCILDDLDVYQPVKDGLEMLKELSAEVNEGYEREDDFFLHPITRSRIEIVMDR